MRRLLISSALPAACPCLDLHAPNQRSWLRPRLGSHAAQTSSSPIVHDLELPRHLLGSSAPPLAPARPAELLLTSASRTLSCRTSHDCAPELLPPWPPKAQGCPLAMAARRSNSSSHHGRLKLELVLPPWSPDAWSHPRDATFPCTRSFTITARCSTMGIFFPLLWVGGAVARWWWCANQRSTCGKEGKEK